MNFAFTPEQEELRQTAQSFLSKRSPESEVRRLMDTTEGYDPDVWQQMAAQLGWHGLAIPERLGGSGYTFAEQAVVCEEMGRVLLCAPYFATVALAVPALLSCDEGAQAEYLPAIAAGETIATVAFTEASGRWNERGVEMTAVGRSGGWRLTGTKTFVLDGHVAGLLIVAARTTAGTSLFAVDGEADGLTRTPLATMDLTRKQARIDFANTPARLLGEEGAGWTVMTRVLDFAAVAMAAEQVGGAQRCLDSAVEYAKERVQFGRPIGSFQAVKHKCADMLLKVESAKSAVYYAAWAAGQDNDELPATASLAKAYCSDAYFHAASENIQIHGGIGFTWEDPAHLYFKRAKSSALILGDAAYHREMLAQRIGI